MSEPITLSLSVDGIESLLDERYEFERDNQALSEIVEGLKAELAKSKAETVIFRKAWIWFALGCIALTVGHLLRDLI